MDRGPDPDGRPPGSSDGFDAIVAGWQREGGVPQWPTDGRWPGDDPPAPDVPEEPAQPEPEDIEEHFVPPEPPPLPRPGPPALIGIGLLVLGLLLVAVPQWVGVPQVYGLPLGLVALACGLGWLVLRLWPDADGGDPWADRDEDGPDDGAVL